MRERATHRVHSRLARAADPELRARLEKLLLVPEGQRRSELDLLRRPPFTPTITGLVRALDRLDRIRALGAGDLDLSGIPAARIVALARYADQAWATQLADLGPERRIATLTAYTHVLTSSARDDVIDIFDVVFGDLQRAATHRGEKRRAGELRDYDQAVAAVHARMRSLLDALDDDPALAAVLEEFRAGRGGIEENMGTVKALMRPPGDPFHERLVASYPADPPVPAQTDRGAGAGGHRLGRRGAGCLPGPRGLAEPSKPRTTRRPAGELPLEVVTPSWQRHVHDATGTVDRAGYTCCVLDQLRTRLRRRDIYAPGSTRWGDPRAELLTRQKPGPSSATRCAKTWPSTLTRKRSSASSPPPWMRHGGAPRPGMPPTPTCESSAVTAATRSCSRRWMPTPNPPRCHRCAARSKKLLPEVEIADLPLEVHGWTGFLDEYTHMAGTETREPGLHRDTLGAAGLRILQRRPDPGRRRDPPAADPGTAELGRA